MKKLGINLILFFLVIAAVYLIFFVPTDEFEMKDKYDEIINRGVLKVGINTDSKPYGFVDANGEVAGFDVDLAKYIARYIIKSSERLQIIPVTPSNRLIKASTGEVDMVISTITITPQREEVVDFSVPYDMAGQAILVRSNSSIKSMADLSGQTVGVIFATTAEKNMKNLVPTANLRGFRSYSNAYKALKKGQIDAITSDDTILNRFAIDDPSVLLLSKRYSKEPYGIAFQKGESTIKLKENVDFALRDLQQKNVINRLKRKWEINI